MVKSSVWHSTRIILGSLVGLTCLLGAVARADTPTIGQPALPVNALDLVTGQPASLAPYAGKVIVLTFMDPSCIFCKAEAPSLVKGYNKYKKKNVVVVAVMLPLQPDPVKAATAFQKKYKFKFPVLLDTPDFGAEHTWGVNAHPENAVIDQQGILRYFTAGYEGAKIEALVKQLTTVPKPPKH